MVIAMEFAAAPLGKLHAGLTPCSSTTITALHIDLRKASSLNKNTIYEINNNIYNSIIYRVIKERVIMGNIITANELKTKGVTLIEKVTAENNEAIITVRGKNKYVILSIEEYNHLREYELEAAIKESLDDIKNGKIYKESIDEHIKRISSV